jgi:hypothetical protein
MKTKKILATLLILAVIVSGFSTINASRMDDDRAADQLKYNYTDLGDGNATWVDGHTYEITLPLNQNYDLGGLLLFAGFTIVKDTNLLEGNVRVSPNVPLARGFRTINAGTWTGIADSGQESIGYIIHVA